MNMELSIVLALALFVWWKYSKREATRKAKRFFEHYDASDLTTLDRWLVDFESMTLFRRVTSMDGAGFDERYEAVVRRAADARWHMILTEGSWRAQVLRAQMLASTSELFQASFKAHLERLSRGPEWLDMPYEVGGCVESAYQRYLRSIDG